MIELKFSSLARRLTSAVFAGLVGLSSAWAQTELPSAQVQALSAKLSQRLKDMPPVESARTTSFPGLIELRAGDNIVTGQYGFLAYRISALANQDFERPIYVRADAKAAGVEVLAYGAEVSPEGLVLQHKLQVLG